MSSTDPGTSGGGGRTSINGLTTSSTCTNTRYRYIPNVVRTAKIAGLKQDLEQAQGELDLTKRQLEGNKGE